MPCSRCGKYVERASDLHWKSLGCLTAGEWDSVCSYKGFSSNAYSTVGITHTWVALCDGCFDFRGGWREYRGMVESERAADYPCATREECVAAWEKAFGPPGLSVEKEVEATTYSGVLVAVVSQEKTSNQYAADAEFLFSPSSPSSPKSRVRSRDPPPRTT